MVVNRPDRKESVDIYTVPISAIEHTCTHTLTCDGPREVKAKFNGKMNAQCVCSCVHRLHVIVCIGWRVGKNYTLNKPFKSTINNIWSSR